jgi:hypothetical protein
MVPSKSRQLHELIKDPAAFTLAMNNIQLRPYQLEPFLAIFDSIIHHRGDTFVIIFSRQSGKDELLANLIVYLLARLNGQESSIVCAQPTFKPQTLNAMDRLDSRLNRPWFSKMHKRSSGYIYHFGRASCSYFSAEPTANVVGATARTLLIINEAQDVDAGVYDKKFAPMAASGNATRVISGTSWTSNTLLARELRSARLAEKADGRKRVFIVTGPEVGRCNPFYADFMQREIAKLGRDHPLVKTQYFCEEIDAQVSMFNPGRLALMKGDLPPQEDPVPGTVYAFLLDVAGQDESRMSLVGADGVRPDGMLQNPGRDSTTLSIVTVDLSTLSTLQAPTYRVVHRRQWTGVNHLIVFGQLQSMADRWQPSHIVVDATGVGEGLWALLDKAFPTRVIPVKFSQQVKSEMGWRFLAIIETGRFRLCSFPDSARIQYDACESEILPGPGKVMRWSVPEGRRTPEGTLVHDDFLLADALVTKLDELAWLSSNPGVIMDSAIDALAELGKNF